MIEDHYLKFSFVLQALARIILHLWQELDLYTTKRPRGDVFRMRIDCVSVFVFPMMQPLGCYRYCLIVLYPSSLKTWQRPTLPHLKMQYHRR